MTTLYKFSQDSSFSTHYWETWEHEGVHFVHWGELGTRGITKKVHSSLFSQASKTVEQEMAEYTAKGYQEFDDEDYTVLLIEYALDGWGDRSDLEKRHRLEDRMAETLGFTGLGNCDGGSIGSGSMEVCCLVVDFEIAKRVIEADLKNTEFANFTRIYPEASID